MAFPRKNVVQVGRTEAGDRDSKPDSVLKGI